MTNVNRYGLFIVSTREITEDNDGAALTAQLIRDGDDESYAEINRTVTVETTALAAVSAEADRLKALVRVPDQGPICPHYDGARIDAAYIVDFATGRKAFAFLATLRQVGIYTMGWDLVSDSDPAVRVV